MAIGAITGAFTGGAGALIGPGTGVALQATLYAVAGAAAGATTAALFGGDIGRGALIGAVSGLAGYALGGVDATLMESGIPLANFASASLKGAVIGGAYAGLTGMDIWDGMLAGAASGAIGEGINVVIGHAAGFIASGGKAPRWQNGVWVYDAENAYFSIGNVWTGRGNLDQEYTGVVGLGETRRFTVRQHEMGHVEQSTWLGGLYLPMHGLSKIIGHIRGDTHLYGPLEGYPAWHSAPMQQCCQ